MKELRSAVRVTVDRTNGTMYTPVTRSAGPLRQGTILQKLMGLTKIAGPFAEEPLLRPAATKVLCQFLQ